MSSMKEIQKAVYDNSYDHGFWDDDFNIPEKLMLIVSEVSEALEDYRKNDMKTYVLENSKPCGFPSEIADVVIRVMDLCQRLGIDLEEEIALKHEFNKSRPYKHGKVC